MSQGSDVPRSNLTAPIWYFFIRPSGYFSSFVDKENMESDLGKLFIGGISWDTDEDRLKEYFGTYGEVEEAVIMKDRVTGRARGFGFVVFSNPSSAVRVLTEKHVIDGRTVEAKKAVPRDYQNVLQRNPGSVSGSRGPGRTNKIFVGGLASTVTESEFKTYFEQFGNITDVVVMYDHNTQRPRGFGFITYDSEEPVDRVLRKTFHELNEKMVEVKRAIPKEILPSPMRSPLPGAYNYNSSRTHNFLNNYASQAYNMNNQYGFLPINTYSDYGMNVNFNANTGSSYGGTSYFNNNLGYGRMLSPFYSNRYTTPIGQSGVSTRTNNSPLNSSVRSIWGNVGPNNPTNFSNSSSCMQFGSIGNFGANWGTDVTTQSRGTSSGFHSFGRMSEMGKASFSSQTASIDSFEGSYGDLYRSIDYVDPMWPSISEIDEPSSFSYGFCDNTSDPAVKNSEEYIENYHVTNTQSNGGIAT